MMYIIIKTVRKMRMAPRPSRQRTRRQQVLTEQGTAHPRPEAVTDPLFYDSAFFDPNDLVQVKYEMLRSVQVEGVRWWRQPRPSGCPARCSTSRKSCSSAKVCRACCRTSVDR